MVKRPPAGTIPDAPGSYQFKDADGRVIYVGKASNLRQRLSNYFQAPQKPPSPHPPDGRDGGVGRVDDGAQRGRGADARVLVDQAARPRFNVRLRDDKSYPFLAVTVDEQWPRAMVMRGRKRKGTRYFGPYAHAYAIRDTLDLLLRSFPIRTCSPAKFNQHQRLGRPCLLYHIEKCSGPCVGEIEEMPYRELVRELCDFLAGDTDEIVHRLEAEMKSAATALEFERAARLRDRLIAVQKAIAKQQMVADKNEDIDVIGIADDDLEASVQVFFVRKGRVWGARASCSTRSRSSRRAGWSTDPRVLYGDEPPTGVPKQVLVPVESEDVATYEEWAVPSAAARASRSRPAAR
jgi:excinuclease ABC subunit C